MGRRAGTVGLLVLVAFSGLQCVQDLIVAPPRVKHEFGVTPARDTLPIVGPQGDPVAFPFTSSLTADGAAVRHGVGISVLQGGSVVQADSAGRLRVVGRGEALLQVRPRNVALPDTLADTVSVLGVVPRIGLDPARVVDTVTSLHDTLVLKAVALTVRGDTIPGVQVPWAQVSGQAAVTLLDAGAGRVRADSDGVAVFRAWVDLVDTVRTVVVRQRPARIALSADTLVFHFGGQLKPATAEVQDARGNAIAGTTPAWTSSDTTVVKLQGAGLLEARNDGTVPVAVSFTRDGATATKNLIAVVRRAHLSVLSGDQQSGIVTGLLGAPLVVQLADALGAVAEPGIAVTFHVSGGGAHFGAPADTTMTDTTVVTDAQGRASVTPRLGRASGVATFTAAGAGLASPAASFSATGAPAPASQVAFQTPPSTRTAGTTFAPAVQVVLRDTLGNVASTSSRDVTLTITPATNPQGAVLAGTATVATVNGVATFSDLRILKAGSGYTLTASATGLPAAASAAFDIAAGPPASIVVTPAGAAVAAGPSQTFVADARDSVGNAVSGGVRWASLNPAVAQVDSLSGIAVADRAGQATIVATAGSVRAYALITATATGGGAVNLWAATPSGTAADLSDVWGASASDVFAVGRGGTILHFDGSAWTAMGGAAASDTLRGVWGTSGSDVFAVGRNGRVLRYAGSGSWTAMTGIDPADDLFAVWGSSPHDVFAVGANASAVGVVYHYDGAAWSRMTAPAAGVLRGLYGLSATDVYATGAGGIVLHYDGTSWAVSLAARGDRDGWRMWGGAPNAVFATANTVPGGQLVMRRFDGTAWTETSTTIAAFRAGLWGGSASEVYVGTDSSGPFVRYDGSTWALMGGARGTPGFGVWGTSDGAVWMVGDGGTVYRGYRAASVAVAPATVGLAALDRTHQLTATVRDAASNVLAGVPVTWSSSAPASVTVDATGLVTAVATGSATVAATAQGGASGGSTVGVTPIAVSLSLAPLSATITSSGATRDFIATSQDSTGHRVLGRRPVWTALVPGVAALAATNDTTARATATGAGQTVVRADLDNRSTSALLTASATGLQPVNVWQVVRPAPDSALTGANFQGVWGASDSALVVVGDQRSYRFDGSAWQEIAALRGVPMLGVAGAAASRLWAAGATGALYEYAGTAWASASSGTSNALRGIWVGSERDVFVGGGNATMLRYDGAAWTPMAMPGSGTASYGSVWGLSASDVWAATTDALAHWDGTAWSSVGLTGGWQGVWGTAANDVFAVGGAGVIAHYDGSTWSTMSSPTLESLRRVWGSSATDVYASGSNGTILHYDGASWSPMPTFQGSRFLYGVWGTPRGTVWAVGGSGPAVVLRGHRGASLTASRTAVTLHALSDTTRLGATVRDAGGGTLADVPLRWTSTAPGVATVDSLTGLVRAVSNGSATVRVTAAGGVYATVSVTVLQVSKTLTLAPAAASLSGAGATRSFAVTAQDSLGNPMPSPTLAWTSPNPTVATVNAAGVVTAVGTGQVVVTATDGGAVGSAVVTVGVPAASPVNLFAATATGVAASFLGIWGAAPSDLFAVGGGAIAHFDGAAWGTMASGLGATLYGVWGTGHGDVFAVGTGGTILHYDGAAWTAMTSGVTVTLFGVWGSSRADVYAAGLSGVLLHYDGTAWSPVVTGTVARFQAVWGTGPADVFVAGSGGTVLHFDGTSWSPMASGTTTLLYGLWGTGPGDVYAISSSGALFHYDGSSWSALGPNPAVTIRAFGGTSGSDLYAVGSSGTIRRWDGSAWTALGGGTISTLNGVWVSGSNHLYVAGGGGVVLRGLRGASVEVVGAGWTATSQGTQQQLTATARDASSATVNGVTFAWTSSNPAAATVDATGLLTAVDTGSTSVVATAAGGAADTLAVTLSALANVVKVTPAGAAMSGVGTTQPLAAEVRDASGNVVPSPTVTWASLDPAVATVDVASGVVTAAGAGQARIVATSGTLTGHALVTVTVPGLQPVNVWAPMASGTTNNLRDVWGTSAADVWASGDGTALALHYDGLQWRTELSGIAGSNTYLGYSVGGSAANDVFVGTDGLGMLARYDGSSWSTITPPAEYGTGIATAVWAASPRETYVGITSTYGGSAGAVARYNQGTWTRVQGPTSVVRLWGAAPGDLFVGGNGTIWRCTGGTCTGSPTPGSPTAIRGLWGASATSAYAVGGGSGYAIAWDGANWTALAGVPGAMLNGITGSAATDLYAVGNGGAIARFDGSAWALATSGTMATLTQAWTSPAGDVFVVGDAGTILRGVRGGTVTVSSPSTSPLAIGSARQLTATAYAGVTPLPGVAFTWASSDTAVARVGAGTGVVTGVAAGTATLTATAAGGAANTLQVTVSGSAGTVATVSVTPANPTLAGYGAAQQLTATARDAANDIIAGVTFTWSSADTAVARVHASTGLVTAFHTGTANITATAAGGKAGSVTVTVEPSATSTVQVFPTGASLAGAGSTQTLGVQVRDPNGDLVSSPTATWASLNPLVATVDPATGVATAVAPGQATITATSGGGTGAGLVTVTAPVSAAVNLWVPMTTAGSTFANAVWGISATDVWAAAGASMLHYDGATWSVVGTPAGNTLTGVWGSSATDVFAVGYNGTIVHYDGSAWTAMTSGTTQSFTDVWGSSHGDVFAVGASGTILHFDGTAWSAMTSGSTATLYAVWGTSHGDVWAAGSSGTILNYNGFTSTWSVVGSGTTASLYDLWGTSPDDVYASGSSGTIVHFDGTAWSAMTTGSTATLQDVWGTSGTDLYAVGSAGAVLRYDGSTWRAAAAGTAAQFMGAWGAGLGDVFAAVGSISGGTYAVSRGIRGATLDAAAGSWIVTAAGNQLQLTATVRDGAGNPLAGVPLAWSSANNAIATVNGSGLVTAVALGSTSVFVTAAGGLADTVAVTVTMVANTVHVLPSSVTLASGGTRYLVVQVLDASGNPVSSPSVTFASLNPAVATVDASTGLVTAVEAGQATMVATSGGLSGSALVTVTKAPVSMVNLWAPLATGTPNGFQGVWGASATGVFAVGSSGTIAAWNGTAWNLMSSGTTQALSDVWGTSATDVYAVGSGGTIVRYNGTTWSPMVSGTTQALSGIWGASRSDVFAVGGTGTILRYDGTSWTAMASGTTQSLLAVWGTSRTDVFAVGGNGTILHYDGAAWAPMSSGTTIYIYDVWGTSPTDVYALSTSSNAMLHYDGASWSALPAGASGYGLWGTTSSNIFVVGSSGAITRWDGSTWTAMTSGTSNSLMEIWGTSASEMTAVNQTGTVLRGIRGATVQVAAGTWNVTPQGNQQQLTATARDGLGAAVGGVAFAWTSTAPSVAAVNASGLVTAVSLGSADIIATAPGGLADTVTVTVSVVANAVTVSPTGVMLAGAGATQTIAVEVRDGSGTVVPSPTVAWASSNPAVATVDASGVVTAVAAGQTTIGATSGSVTGYATVTVSTPGTTPVNLWAPGTPPAGYTTLTGVWGSSATNVYAAGGSSQLWHWDGSAWSSFTTGVSGSYVTLWGSSASDVFAVGYAGAVAHWDGSAWTAMTSGTSQALNAVWGASPRDVFAVGNSGAIVHYDGSSWGPMASGTTQPLYGVWGSSRSDVYAVGYAGALLHYDGIAWSTMPGAQTYWYPRAVWGTGPTDVFAVGSGFYHWNGATWSEAPVSPSNTLQGVWGTSPSDVYAVGYSGGLARYNGTTWTVTSTTSMPTLTAVWSLGGSDLTVVGYSGSGSGVLRGVRGATIAIAAGGWTISGTGAHQQLTATVRDGSGAILSGVPLSWTSANTAVATVSSSGLVTGVALDTVTVTATAPGGATAHILVTVAMVANSVTVTPAGAAVAGVGTTQSFMATVRDGLGNIVPSPTVAWASLNPSVATVDPATGVATAVAAGQATIAATSGAVTSYALLTVAAAGASRVNLWARATTGTTSEVNGVWAASPTDMFAVGGGGLILHFDGSTWNPMSGGLGSYLYDVWGASGTDVFAVGGGGAIRHYDGTSWSPMNGGTSQYLQDVWGSSGSDVFAVGAGGTIVHYDGTAWTTMVSGTSAQLQAVWGTSRSDVFAVGSDGTILHYDGSVWSAMPGGMGWYLTDVWGTSPTNVYVSTYNAVLRYDGSAWTEMPGSPYAATIWGTAPTEVFEAYGANISLYDGSTWTRVGATGWLSALTGTTTGSVYATGQGGTILRGVRGGTLSATAGTWAVTAQGNQLQVTATVRDQAAADVPGAILTWRSTNPAVAVVDATGLVTAVSVGGASIVVTAMGGLADTVPVTVNLVANQVTVVPGSATLNGAGATQTMSAAVRDAAGNIIPSPTVTWTSLNPAVASVNASTGVVTAMAAGQATIVATSGSLSATALVTATAATPAAVNLWAPAYTPATGSNLQVYGVWGTSANDVWAVGSNATVYHFNGTAWSASAQVAGVYQELHDVWGTSASDIFAVGGYGTVLHFNGSAWSVMPTGTTVYLQAVWGSSPTDVYAAGEYGTLLHYDGSAWSAVPSGMMDWYGPKIWGSSRNDVYVVSGSGTIHFDGTSWSPVPSVGWAYAVWGTAPTDVYAASWAVLRYNGAGWSQMPGSTGSAFGLWGSSGAEMYAVRDQGGVASWNGATWTDYLGVADRDLNNVWGTSSGDVYAVGTNWYGLNAGIIMRGVRGATVTVSPTNPSITGLGTTQQLTATGYKGATPVPGVAFTWTSSNPAVATVSTTGLVTAVAAGSATITATAPGGAAQGTTVTVSP